MTESKDDRSPKEARKADANKQDSAHLFNEAVGDPGKLVGGTRAQDLARRSDANIEAAATTAGLFRAAIGLEHVPQRGHVELTVKKAEMQAQRAEGISRAQNVSFVDASGDQLTGVQYTKAGGTVFKTREGDTYNVQSDPTGGFILRLAADVESFFTAVKMLVLPDLQGMTMESRLTARKGNEEATLLSSEKKVAEVTAPIVSFEPVQNPVAPIDITLPVPTAALEAPVEPVPDGKPFEDLEAAMEVIAPAAIVSDATQVVPPHDFESFIVQPETEKPSQDEQEEQEEESSEQALVEQNQQSREERRRRYIVKDKDTLQTIAVKQLRDVRLAELIFNINKHLIPVKMVRGRPVRELKPRQIIYLPTSLEVEEYRTQIGSGFDVKAEDVELEIESSFDDMANGIFANQSQSTQPEPGEDKAEQSPTQNEDATVAVTRATHIVRLGDTLKSIAIKHKDLGNVSLWVLLGQVNGLSTVTDEKGAPTVTLTRGMKLVIPTADEIAQFRQSNLDAPSN
jgi:hypothetical protein